MKRQEFSVVSRSEMDTQTLGQSLAPFLEPPLVVALYGPLGAGKTTLVRGIARGLGIKRVRSPSFLIMLRYRGPRGDLYHLDLYRLSEQEVEELIQIGVPEVFERHLVVVEWAERLGPLLPEERLDIHLDFLDGARRIHLAGLGEKPARVVAQLARSFTPPVPRENP